MTTPTVRLKADTTNSTVVVVALLAASLVFGAHLQAQQNQQAAAPHVVPIRGNTYLIAGAGGNITLSVGNDGVLMVDTGLAQNADRVLATIQRLQLDVQQRQLKEAERTAIRMGAETRSSIAGANIPAVLKPIRYILNTHVHPDHTGGNEKFRLSGRTFTGGNVANDIRDAVEGAAILAHENVLVRMTQAGEGQQPAPPDAQPTDTYYNDVMKMSHFFNGEGVQLVHAPKAHSDGDSIVVFRGSDVIAAGDVYLTESYPIIDVERGGTINGIVDALNRIIDLSQPEFRTEGGTLVIPGHGRISDTADVTFYRDMTVILRDRVQDMIKKGMTLDQIKNAKITGDYEPRYGATSGFWTTDKFLEAMFATLGGGQKPVAPAAPARRRR